jgi:N-acetylmuramic acid 6-phosphate etherase
MNEPAHIPMTEGRNPATMHIDTLSTPDMLRAINAEDMRVPLAVAEAIDAIAAAVDAIHARMQQGGRLIYTGAGTSGRLGVVDASEMPPTYNVPHDLVIGLIAGGQGAMFNTAEDVEDDVELGKADIARLQVRALDSVIGIAASGRTPYVIGTLQEARSRGALAVSMACTSPAAMHAYADINISLITGPEVVTGSTRMKAGTATKLALNMISTSLMIKLGKTYGNLMVDLQPSNSKLRDRAQRIVVAATGLSPEEAQRLLETCGDVKTSIVVALMGCSAEEARARLMRASGRVAAALKL